MKILHFIIHSFKECPDNDIEWFKNKKGTCKKCGRVYFNFMR